MNEADVKNKEIILDLYSRYSLSEKGLAFVKSWFDDPKIDPIYAAHYGDDLRKRWPIDFNVLSKLGLNQDKGWELFKNFFYTYMCHDGRQRYDFPNITYDNYRENRVLYKKNTVKLKSIFEEYYDKVLKGGRANYFNHDYQQVLNYQSHHEIKGAKLPSLNGDITKEHIEAFILKANEIIGTFKAPKTSDYELVMTNNMADWLLCSTKEEWGSCLNTEANYGYWAGIPFLIDDMNRTMFYVTKGGRKKEHIGLKVDGMENRSWGLLNNNNKICVIRWFPRNFFDSNVMRDVTGLPLFYYGEGGFDRSKYSIFTNISFKDGVVQTPYLDHIGLNKSDKKDIHYGRGGNGGTNHINVLDRETTYHKTNDGIERFIRSKKTFFNYLYNLSCYNCDVEVEYGTFEYRGNRYCDACKEKLFFKCDVCGKYHPKTQKKVFEGDSFCEDCFKKSLVSCKCCGKIYRKKDDSELGFCDECFATKKAIKCSVCGEGFAVSNGVFFYSENEPTHVVCSEECGKKFMENAKYIKGMKYFKCSDCKKWYDINDAEYFIDGKPICKKDMFKRVDANQLKFNFIKK